MASKDWRPLLARLRALPHVTAAAPGLYGQVLISRGARSGGALMKGVIPADERTVSDLLQSVKQGGSAAALEPDDTQVSESQTLGGSGQTLGHPMLRPVCRRCRRL